jgi:hypothetical protein
MGALQALERAVFEAFRTIADSRGYHPHLAFGTTRTVDRQKLWVGFFPAAHVEK